MLFNSLIFIVLFLPITLIGYFLLNKNKYILAGKWWLVLTSIFFYGYWNILYLPLIMGSMIFNYVIGATIGKSKIKGINKKRILAFGVIANILLLIYYKYVDFFINNINYVLGANIELLNLVLPLGISFFTFTQIAFLVDNYYGKATKYDFLNYILFVTFFPHLIAGPIIHHKEMMPQFDTIRNKIFDLNNFYKGILLFSLGIFKKVMIADNVAKVANFGFDYTTSLNLIEAWATSLAYTVQLYFDFSGYTDMALGLALMFNIILPRNFNSPYKALNIQEFWRRWHMTLSRFLRDYIYIPLGGSRDGNFNTYRNLFLTFLIGGIWHGAGWTFIIWGALNGFASVLHKWWEKLGIKMNKIIAWVITFNFVNICWIFFRAKTIDDAFKVLKGMIGLNGIVLPSFLKPQGTYPNMLEFGAWFELIEGTQIDRIISLGMIGVSLIVALTAINSDQMQSKTKKNIISLVIYIILFTTGFLNMNRISEFLYFQF